MPSQEVMLKIAQKVKEGTLKTLKDDEEFATGCEQCGKCCRNRVDILLTPYDFFHLVKAKNMPPLDLLKKYTNVFSRINTKIPIVQVRFREEMDGSCTCPFLGRRDEKFYCRIHENKPTVCRIYPLGRMIRYDDISGKPSNEVLYFEQPEEGYVCGGIRKARENNEMHSVMEWIGGKEKKDSSDKAFAFFNQYISEAHRTVNMEELFKLESEDFKNACYNMIFALMYLEYDFSVDDDAFLCQYEKNMEKMIEILTILAHHPSNKLKPKFSIKRNQA